MEDIFSTKTEKSRKKNKNLSSQIFIVGNIVNDSLNDEYLLNLYIITRILFRIKHLIELGVYKETFVNSVYKTLSGAHL